MEKRNLIGTKVYVPLTVTNISGSEIAIPEMTIIHGQLLDGSGLSIAQSNIVLLMDIRSIEEIPTTFSPIEEVVIQDEDINDEEVEDEATNDEEVEDEATNDEEVEETVKVKSIPFKKKLK